MKMTNFVYATGSPFRRAELFMGSTDAQGEFTVTYAVPYTVLPFVDVRGLPGAVAGIQLRLTASSLEGFTVKAEQHAGATLLGIDVLGTGYTAVAGVPVHVQVTLPHIHFEAPVVPVAPS